MRYNLLHLSNIAAIHFTVRGNYLAVTSDDFLRQALRNPAYSRGARACPNAENETGQLGEQLAGSWLAFRLRGGSGNPAADDGRRHHVEHSRNTEEGDGE